MAPEQITGDRSVSGKADLYSLGCCLFEMLVGRPPFQGDNFAQLFEQHLRTEAPHVRDFAGSCPVELDTMVSRLLNKHPEDRPFNARQVQGLMLQLDTDRDADRSSEEKRPGVDVAAAAVDARGRDFLQQEIREAAAADSKEVSWGRIFVVVAIVLVVIAFAVLSGFK